MAYTVIIFLLFFTGFILTTLANFFMPWLLLPDVILVFICYLHFFAPQIHIWRVLLPVSLLMDLGTGAPLGFHGMLYTLISLAIFPLRTYWQRAPVFEQLIAVTILSVLFVLLKYLLYSVIVGIPAPQYWWWCIVAQILVWPFARYLVLWVIQRFLARAIV